MLPAAARQSSRVLGQHKAPDPWVRPKGVNRAGDQLLDSTWPPIPTMVGMGMSENVAKLSVSIPAALAKDVRRRAGPRGLSGFVARAISHELEHEQLGSFLEQLQEGADPVSPAELKKARRAWPKR